MEKSGRKVSTSMDIISQDKKMTIPMKVDSEKVKSKLKEDKEERRKSWNKNEKNH